MSKDLKEEGSSHVEIWGEECSRLGKQSVQGPWGRIVFGSF